MTIQQNFHEPIKIVMNLTNNTVDLIKQKFPMQSGRIEELYQSNDDFRSLCVDYLYCLNELQKIDRDVDEKKVSVKEYQKLEEDLESELFRFIFPD